MTMGQRDRGGALAYRRADAFDRAGADITATANTPGTVDSSAPTHVFPGWQPPRR
jgi:hypothetical protein